MKFTGLILFIQAFILVEGSGQDCIRYLVSGRGTPRNCSEWAAANGVTSGVHTVTVDPDGDGTEFPAVNVTCDLDQQAGSACLVLNHNKEARTYVKGYDTCFGYRFNVVYDIGLNNVTSILDNYPACKQHIKYECYHAVLTWGPNSLCTGWENRYGSRSSYYTGDGSGSRYCDCPTCSRTTGCNCDSNTQTWQTDEGYVTNKSDLPITAFAAGDTGYTYEQGYITIGPVICC